MLPRRKSGVMDNFVDVVDNCEEDSDLLKQLFGELVEYFLKPKYRHF